MRFLICVEGVVLEPDCFRAATVGYKLSTGN